MTGRCLRRWLSRPIRARQTFPQVGHVCSDPVVVVDALPARALCASRLVSASFSHLSSASRAHAMQSSSLQDFPTCCRRCRSFSQKPTNCLCNAFSVLRLSVYPCIVRRRGAVLVVGCPAFAPRVQPI